MIDVISDVTKVKTKDEPFPDTFKLSDAGYLS